MITVFLIIMVIVLLAALGICIKLLKFALKAGWGIFKILLGVFCTPIFFVVCIILLAGNIFGIL